MENPTSVRPILKKNPDVEAFVPSPRFLSESPARQPSSGKQTPAHISRPGQPLPPHAFSPSPSFRQLRSPIPPPPANLFGGRPDAFNVDPGIPFLATAGGSDVGSITSHEHPKQSSGGFVTGLKKALTIKGSRRQSSKYQQTGETMYPDPTTFRDSGYAEPPPNQPPALTTFSPSPSEPRDLLPATSEPPFNDLHDYHNDSPAPDSFDSPSLDSMASAVTAHVGYGPDYAKMDRPTPPQSDVSFNTYVTRFQNFVHDLVSLPWIAKERVTVDYYPTSSSRRDRRLTHRPLITWRSQDYNPPDYQLDSDTSESSTLKMAPRMRVRAPSHASRANLDSEFSDKTNSPFPYHPPNLVRTPDHRRAQSESVRSGLGGETTPHASNSHLPPSNQQRWDNPAANPTETFVPYRPSTLPQFPPNSDQTPNPSKPYGEELTPWSRNDATPALLKTPSRRISLSQRGEPWPVLPSNADRTPRTRGEDLRYDTNPTFSTPIRQRPISVQPTPSLRGDPFPTTPTSDQRRESTPKHASSQPIPETPPSSHRRRRSGSGSGRQPTLGSPSRHSHKSHNTQSQRPRQEGTDEWESYPQDRPGYVPFPFSEHYYGTKYGVGIHGLLPPVGRAASAGSTAPSIKQPQPQYPRPALVTPPSQVNSPS